MDGVRYDGWGYPTGNSSYTWRRSRDTHCLEVERFSSSSILFIPLLNGVPQRSLYGFLYDGTPYSFYRLTRRWGLVVVVVVVVVLVVSVVFVVPYHTGGTRLSKDGGSTCTACFCFLLLSWYISTFTYAGILYNIYFGHFGSLSKRFFILIGIV